MPVSKFKATCLAVLERVRETGQPLLVTHRGEPLAEVVPPRLVSRHGTGYGSMSGTARELGNIVEPVGGEEWEALQ